MSAAEERPRPDLTSLRIHREDEPAPGSFRWGRLLLWVVVLAVGGLAAVLGYEKWIVPGRAPLVEVTTARPTIVVAHAPILSATGYLVADKTAKITPKISGKVVSLNFDTGTKVKKGDVLVVLESTNLQAQLDEAQANLAEAQREYDRQLHLWRDGLASRSVLDSAEAQLKVSLARVDQIRINMNDMVVRAPFDGTIATKSTEIGEVISSVMMGQVAGTLPAGAIATLVDLSTLQVETDVNESALAQLRVGQPAEVAIDAFPGRKWKGYLKQIIPTADRSKGIVKVKVAIVDPSDRLLPEMASTVSFLETPRTDAELREPARIWLPERAIVSQGGPKVAVVDAHHKVHLHGVSTGQLRDGRVEVSAGVKDGDRIVSNPEGLREGQLVRLKDEEEK